MRYYSQTGEDYWLDKSGILPENGVFFECGACNGIKLSNTKFFEDKGWTGAVAEADPRWFDDLKNNRKCKIFYCAVGTGKFIKFTKHKTDPELSGLNRNVSEGEEITVEVKSLNSILEESNIDHLDLLSIDVEGSELDVWRSLDYKKYKPKVVVVEYVTRGMPLADKELIDEMTSCGYKEIHRTAYNLIFQIIE